MTISENDLSGPGLEYAELLSIVKAWHPGSSQPEVLLAWFADAGYVWNRESLEQRLERLEVIAEAAERAAAAAECAAAAAAGEIARLSARLEALLEQTAPLLAEAERRLGKRRLGGKRKGYGDAEV